MAGILLFALAGINCSYIGSFIFDNRFESVEAAQRWQATQPAPPPEILDNRLLVMTWNVKFAGGRIDFFFDCWGDRVLMEPAEVSAAIDGLVKKINQVNPHLLFLQEVDVKSDRVAELDMVQEILDRTRLSYGVYASHWRTTVPRKGIGFVNSGNAILSRWELTDAVRYALPLRTDQDPITRQFYLKRNILKTKVAVPGAGAITLLNLHAAAFSRDGTKKKQIDALKKKMDELNSDNSFFIAGGDFNTIPPGSDKSVDFPDSKCEGEFEADDYREEKDWLTGYYRDYKAAIPLAEYRANNAAYFTHTTKGDGFWNRKLDYLFTNGHFVPGSGMVHQDKNSGGMETMPLSDHAPLTVIVDLQKSAKPAAN